LVGENAPRRGRGTEAKSIITNGKGEKSAKTSPDLVMRSKREIPGPQGREAFSHREENREF